MLPRERTTTLESTLPVPGNVEALVAAPGRSVARPLITFLRSQGLQVHLTADADSTFEEALVHPPDVVLIDDRIPPAGGIELCQRLKGNIRTHFVPAILFAANDVRQNRLRALEAGADAVFSPSTDAQERRTRLWALLRTRALQRQVDKRSRNRQAESVERRRFLDGFLARTGRTVAALRADLDELDRRRGVEPDRGMEALIGRMRYELLLLDSEGRAAVDLDRLQDGDLAPGAGEIDLGALVAAAVREVTPGAELKGRALLLTPPGRRVPPFAGDADLVSRAVVGLLLFVLQRGVAGKPVGIDIEPAGAGARLRVLDHGPPLGPAERELLSRPLGMASTAADGMSIGLSLARAVAERQGGIFWIEDRPVGSCFVMELQSGAVHHDGRLTPKLGS